MHWKTYHHHGAATRSHHEYPPPVDIQVIPQNPPYHPHNSLTVGPSPVRQRIVAGNIPAATIMRTAREYANEAILFRCQTIRRLLKVALRCAGALMYRYHHSWIRSEFFGHVNVECSALYAVFRISFRSDLCELAWDGKSCDCEVDEQVQDQGD
jgi:hypothetical protein